MKIFLTEIPPSEDEYYQSFQILKVNALREMTAFGCRMKAPNYKSSPFEHTNWFKFTVESNDVLLVEDALADVDVKVDVEVKRSLKFSWMPIITSQRLYTFFSLHLDWRHLGWKRRETFEYLAYSGPGNRNNRIHYLCCLFWHNTLLQNWGFVK